MRSRNHPKVAQDRQADRQIDKQTDRHANSQTEKQIEKKFNTVTPMSLKTEREIDRERD